MKDGRDQVDFESFRRSMLAAMASNNIAEETAAHVRHTETDLLRAIRGSAAHKPAVHSPANDHFWMPIRPTPLTQGLLTKQRQ